VAKHSDELRFQELVEAVERLLAPGRPLAVIVPLNREADLLWRLTHRAGPSKRRCSVRYVSHPTRQTSACWSWMPVVEPVVEEQLTLEATDPLITSPEYRALISDLMLNF
jgi:hypothetical protein